MSAVGAPSCRHRPKRGPGLQSTGPLTVPSAVVPTFAIWVVTLGITTASAFTLGTGATCPDGTGTPLPVTAGWSATPGTCRAALDPPRLARSQVAQAVPSPRPLPIPNTPR